MPTRFSLVLFDGLSRMGYLNDVPPQAGTVWDATGQMHSRVHSPQHYSCWINQAPIPVPLGMDTLLK